MTGPRNEQATRQRFRYLVGCLGFVALAFSQQPGRIVADTKLDLVVSPDAFLVRALSMWDPDGFFGQVQNQAYGYLFPMGPFFLLGDLIRLDPWITQRLWWSLVMCVAFVGAARLCEVLGVGTPALRLLAGVAFALSPRFLTGLGPSSIEVWPSALAPWVLIPLVVGLRRGDPRKQAALSALAVAAVGGVNAAATFAVIPLAAIWLLMAPAGPRRRAMMWWWPPLVLLGTAWWLAPLFLLGRFSPPFLDYIESASITTSAATPYDALRGATNWVAYIAPNSDAGKLVIQDPTVLLNVGVLVALGVAGLALRDLAHRRFLFVGLLAGLVLVTLGHLGSVEGLGSEWLQAQLDAVLAPIRNTHKFDVVVRLPLIIAAVHAVAVARRTVGGASVSGDGMAFRRAGVALVAVAAVAGATSPAWTGHVANRGSFEAIPKYWQDAAHWLGENDRDGVALMLPASAFGEYVWGSTSDEPLQPLAESAWVVRNSIPLTPPGTIRVLDSFSDALAQGTGAKDLARTLQRAGIDHLVIRNDLDPAIAAGRTEALYQSLDRTEGLRRVAEFGPELGGTGSIDLDSIRTFAHGGWQAPHPAVEIFSVEPTASSSSVSTGAVPTIVGGPETITTLDALGLISNSPTVLARDVPGDVSHGPLILTDGFRRQEVAFGSVDRVRSSSVAFDEPFSLLRPVHDYVENADARWWSVPRLEGARRLTASSARSRATTPGGVDPSTSPWAAFDGDPATRWEATEPRAQIRLELGGPTDLRTVIITPQHASGERSTIRVRTEDGVEEVSTVGSSPVSVDVGRVSALEIEGANASNQPFALASVESTALDLARPLVLPATDRSWGAAQTVVLGADSGRRPGCLVVRGIARCRAGVEAAGEDDRLIDRVIPVSVGADYDVEIRTRSVAGAGVDELLQTGMPWRVSASSTATSDVRTSAVRVVDRAESTAWIADPDDSDPTLTIAFDAPRTFSSIRLRLLRSLPASTAKSVVLELDDGTQQRVELERGRGTFAPVTTTTLRIHLESAQDAQDYIGETFGSILPVGVSELEMGGSGRRITTSTEVRELPCGSGPSIQIGTKVVQTSVRASDEDIAEGNDVVARPCQDESVELVEGDNRLTVRASELFAAGTVVMTRSTPPVTSPADGARYVVKKHNVNDGWKARLDGTALKSVRLNGWQQGWMIPADVDAAAVDADVRFAPEDRYRISLALGAILLLTLVELALLRARRPWGPPDPVPAESPGRWVLVATVAAVAVVTGLWGLVAATVGAGVAALLRRRGVPAVWPVAIPLMVAAVTYALVPWGSSAVWVGTWSLPQVCVAVSLGATAFAVLRSRGFFSRRKGSSTVR